MEEKLRFVRRSDEDLAEERYPDIVYEGWYDSEKDQVIRMPMGKDPNKIVFHPELYLLFTDQAEYYAVCPNCYSAYRDMQWSGSTHAFNWRATSQEFLKRHQEMNGWCEFCDPELGNGGWR